MHCYFCLNIPFSFNEHLTNGEGRLVCLAAQVPFPVLLRLLDPHLARFSFRPPPGPRLPQSPSHRFSGGGFFQLSFIWKRLDFTFTFTVFSPEGVFWALLMSPSRHRGPHVLRGGDRPTWGPHHLFPIRQGPPSLPDRCPGSRAPWLTACHTGHLPVHRPPCGPSVPCPRRSPRHVCCRPYL